MQQRKYGKRDFLIDAITAPIFVGVLLALMIIIAGDYDPMMMYASAGIYLLLWFRVRRKLLVNRK